MRVGRLASIAILCTAAFLPARLLAVAPGAAPTPGALATLPWPSWFEKNTTVSDKKTYVHMMWDAEAVRGRFEGKDERAFIAEAARQLVRLRNPGNASPDAVRIDIVFVTERDEYGNPKWDTLQRVAHLEGSRKAVLEASEADLEKAFAKFEIFR